jgi:6-phosphogluconate dehydrogenase
MKLAMIGLGKMGGNMATRLVRAGHEVIAYDPNAEARSKAAENGSVPADSFDAVVEQLQGPRIVWTMVPAGQITDDTVSEFSKRLSPGDIIIDGGNSNYKESQRRNAEVGEKEIAFIDAGVSGGVWGLENGYCLMVGGEDASVKTCEPIFLSLAPDNGYSHVGPSGAGHFVKMVHNGIEYGLMQSYAEGFELLKSASEFDLDLHEISSIWRYGSVVRSWLLELLELALKNEESFNMIKGYVDDSGEGRWTIDEAVARSVPMPVITASLFARFASRQDESFAAKINAALRNQFGGHAVHEES